MWRILRIKDDSRLEFRNVNMEDGDVLNKRVKDDRITVTGDL